MSAKIDIIEYMRAARRAGHEIVPGGTIEREVSKISSCKPSIVDRRRRELVESGWLEGVDMEWNGKKFKGYKLIK